MASTKVSAMTEATDITESDEFYVNVGGASRRITKKNLRQSTGWLWAPPDGAIGDSHASFDNTDANKYRSMVMDAGPSWGSKQYAVGQTKGSVHYFRECTDIDSIVYQVLQAVATGSCYFVMYDISDDGLPTGAPIWQHTMADVTSTGTKTETGLTPWSIAEGWYFFAVLVADAASGTLKMEAMQNVHPGGGTQDPNSANGVSMWFNGNDTTPATFTGAEAWLADGNYAPHVGVLDSTS